MEKYNWVPHSADLALINLIDKIVTKDVMAEARTIYKNETGKACNNFAMERCLKMAVEQVLLIVDHTVKGDIPKNIASQEAIDMIISGVLKGLKKEN